MTPDYLTAAMIAQRSGLRFTAHSMLVEHYRTQGIFPAHFPKPFAGAVPPTVEARNLTPADNPAPVVIGRGGRISTNK